MLESLFIAKVLRTDFFYRKAPVAASVFLKTLVFCTDTMMLYFIGTNLTVSR